MGDPCAGQLKLCESVSVTAKSPKLFELDENFGAVDPIGSDQGKVIFIQSYVILRGRRLNQIFS